MLAPALAKRPTPPREEADGLWLTRTDWGASIIHFRSYGVSRFQCEVAIQPFSVMVDNATSVSAIGNGPHGHPRPQQTP